MSILGGKKIISLVAKNFGNSASIFASKTSSLAILKKRALTTSCDSDNNVVVNWANSSQVGEFPSIWLRDNCQCPKCFHPVSKARLVLMRENHLDIKPQTVTFNKESRQLEICWPDGHHSCFEEKWLQDRIFCQDNVDRFRKLVGRPTPTLWKKEHGPNIQRYDFKDIMENEKTLFHWLVGLEVTGLTLIENVTCEKDTLLQLIHRSSGLPKMTHYGQDFEVYSKDDPNNVAYTTSTLGLHLDLPFYEYNPGVQFLHCIKQYEMKGGENEFVDGFQLAQIVKENHPEEWKTLTQVPINFWDIGESDVSDFTGEFHKITARPTFELDQRGQITRLNYNNQVRDSVLAVNSPKVVRAVYKAFMLLDSLAYDPDNMINYKLKEGECVAFDNQRVLHGRKGYKPVVGGHRHLQGGYTDWDEIRSKMNVLKEKLGL